MDPKQIIAQIREKAPVIKSVYFVGCGASYAELYPAKYFLEQESKVLRTGHFTANEFVYDTPAAVDETAIVIGCSLGGNTPEAVEAVKVARARGAHTVAITHHGDSALAEEAEYTIVHGFEANYAAKLEKMTNALLLAAEIMNTYEGCACYDDVITAADRIYDLIEKAVSFVSGDAEVFAQRYKDAPVIYVTSSGATQCVAYTFSLFLMMEMQWINSAQFHDGEYFHGPFEVTEKDVPFILLMNDGKTRPLDTRALTFLQRFDAKLTVVDGKDYGVGTLPASVKEYFNPMVVTAVLRVYAEHLAAARQHPLTMRRYMWKLEY